MPGPSKSEAQTLIKAILFDLDDTLLDRNAAIDPFIKDLYRSYGPRGSSFETFCRRFKELDRL
jgi:FMN phosphatase YigB (HAD superfamily)